MSILGVSNAVTGAYQHMGRTQKNTARGASFTERAGQTQEVSDAEKLEIIREYAIGSNKMCGGTLINIDENGYKGYSYMADHAKEAESAFSAHSKDKDSFYVKKAEKKREYRKLLEEKRLKQELAEKDLKVALERKRLTENAIERKQESGRMSRNVSAGANAAYEASFLMADGGSI